MRNILLSIVINSLALASAAWLVAGISYGNLGDLLIVAIIFGLVNTLLKPILKLLTCPLMLLTLGLFTFVLNGLLLWLTSSLAGVFGSAFTVDGFWAAFWGALIVSAVSVILSIFLKD